MENMPCPSATRLDNEKLITDLQATKEEGEKLSKLVTAQAT